MPWIIEVGAGSTLELRNLTLSNFAPVSRAGNGSFSQYLFVSDLITWPSITAQPGATIRLVNVTTQFWSKTLFRNADCITAATVPKPPEEQARAKVWPFCGGPHVLVDQHEYQLLSVTDSQKFRLVGWTSLCIHNPRPEMPEVVPLLCGRPLQSRE